MSKTIKIKSVVDCPALSKMVSIKDCIDCDYKNVIDIDNIKCNY